LGRGGDALVTRLGLMALAVAVAFGFGLFLGRAFPAHRYVSLGGDTPFVLDTATGKVCTPFAGTSVKLPVCAEP
jgi:hypothetical protein